MRFAAAWLLIPAVAAGQGLRDQRDKVRDRLFAERAALASVRNEKGSLLQVLDLIERRARQSVDRAKLLDRQLKGLKQKIALAEKQEEISRLALDETIKRLAPRLKVTYRTLRRNPLDVLLDARDFSSLMGRSRALGLVLERDVDLVRDAERAFRFQSMSLRQLDWLKSTLGVRIAALKDERDEAEAQRLEMADMLNLLKAEASQSSRVVKELEDAEGDLSRLIDEMESELPTSGFGARKGQLPMPAKGLVAAGYGKVVNPKFNTVTLRKGLDLRAPAGTEVFAVGDGKVVYAAWMRGYGNLLVLDHGGGFHTLVAHLADFKKSPGDDVKAGEPVGTVGDTGSLNGTYLYFELRQRGLAVDPAPWFAPVDVATK